MNNKEITRHKANLRVADFLHDHHEEIKDIPLYTDIKASFDVEMLKIHNALIKQAKQISPITQSKKRLRLIMAETMVKFLQRAAVQCNNNGNFSLEETLTKGKTYFTRGMNSLAPVKARNLKELIVKHNNELTIITAADIAEMETAISQFEALVNVPQEEIKNKKANSTMLIPLVLNQLDTIKDQIGKLIYSYLPHLAYPWAQTIKVGHDTGIRHISLVIKVISSEVNVPLYKVKCTINNGIEHIIKYSTRRGGIRFKSLQNANWTVTIEYPFYHTEFLENIATFENKFTRLQISLRKISDNM